MSLDLSRPQIRRVRKDTGFAVIEYRDNPGHYFHPNGDPATEEDAIQCGFDIEEGRKNAEAARRRQALEAELALERANDEPTTEPAPAPAGGPSPEAGQQPVAPPKASYEVRRKPGKPREDGRNFRVVNENGDTLLDDLTEGEADEALASLQ